jgi:hypothetical protein
MALQPIPRDRVILRVVFLDLLRLICKFHVACGQNLPLSSEYCTLLFSHSTPLREPEASANPRARYCRQNQEAGLEPCGHAVRDPPDCGVTSACPLCSFRRGDRITKPFAAVHESAIGRFCCISPLRSFLVSDSVAVRRFATGAGYDGAADSRPGTVFLFISSR